MSDSVNGQSTVAEPGEQNVTGPITKQEPAASPLTEDSSLSSVVTDGFFSASVLTDGLVSVVGPYLPKAERLPWPEFLRLTAWCMLP